MMYSSNEYELGGCVLQPHELEFHAVRAQGPGGQHVNKVSSAIHLRFDVTASSLPDDVKERLLRCHDHRINKQGVIVIKAQRYRTREKNRQDAIQRLDEIISSASRKRKTRKLTRPGRAARLKLREHKIHRSRTKELRRRIKHYS